MTERRLIYLASLVGAVVFYVCYQEWFSWFALLLIAGIPWLSLALSLPAMLTFRGEPTGPAAVEMGTPAKTKLMGKCRAPLPPFRGKLRVTRCSTGEQWRYKGGMVLPTDHCGGLKITAEKVRVCDYLGLFTLRVRRTEARTVLVRPRPVAMGEIPSLDRYLARAWRPKPGGGFAENHELRLYRPGDNLNQVHWKLTAKTGKLILREPMEPERGLVLVTMNLRGTAEELDRKFGRLLWLGRLLLEKNVHFEIRVLTGEGVKAWPVAGEDELGQAVDELLCTPPGLEGDLREKQYRASWHCYIGGGPDEA